MLLGFDTRVPRGGDVRTWDGETRGRYLYRPDVVYVQSVDVMVWPSLFDTGVGLGMSDEMRRSLGLAGRKLPGWTGPNHGIWDSLPSLQDCLAAQETPVESYWLVALTARPVGSLRAPQGPYGPYLTAVTPEFLPPTWRLLGYDVADGSRTSGLSNCGIPGGTAEDRRRQWGHLLNAHHLFRHVRSANRFREFANGTVPEHRPFFVYGLWLRPGSAFAPRR